MPKLKIFHRLLLVSLLLVIICAPLASSASILNPDTSMEPPKLQIPIPGMEPFQASVPDSLGTISNSWIAEYIVAIYRYGIGIIGIVAMIAIAYGGIRRVVSMGNPGSISESKAWINSGLAGLALGLGSYMMLSMINTDLVNFKNITITGVQDTEPSPDDFTSSGGQLTGAFSGRASFTTNVTIYDQWIRDEAKATGVDCSLIKAIMMAESNGNPKAESKDKKGQPLAKGLMQIIDKTFTSLNVGGDPFDPQTSIKGGAKYLAQLKSTACNGTSKKGPCNVSDIKYIIAAYNGGPKANKESLSCLTPSQTYWQCTVNKGYAETRNYVAKVLANQQKIINDKLGCN